jgi:GTP-binding protein Era
MSFKSGFVNIIGKPNVGKSTLMNALMGEKLSIVSPKVQTTRHRILGIITEENYQIVFSDTPGIIPKPKYKLHEAMMRFVKQALEDADVVLYMIDSKEDDDRLPTILNMIKEEEKPLFLIINKIDLLNQDQVVNLMKRWSAVVPEDHIIPISAIKGFNIQAIKDRALENLPEGEPYFPEDQTTDKSERFLVSEMIRERIFNFTRQEIPYSTEVVVTAFKEEEDIIRIMAEIFVERQSQKGILIGKGGESLKIMGTNVRRDLEQQYGKRIYLELFVKVKEDWRGSDHMLRQFGYEGSE